ncbi:YdaS family helix-turn-helix protein [Variovorax sp. J22G73]|uniref:carph-isopro domain-containing protein n=1 Tax=unclassified Variovorax TaxID=663243 RepID=UPI0025771AF3|nr:MULTISPECIES: YdaS family helix-turn-helix protein [unclassified Variovorax]MDM0003912.1 YdaS family helix-turn-helix protein [Variovorax sp. J22R203]MDM0096422.1 YdaS family helix-turn-helix protein [Variovorax sp. J22G73]
MDVNQLLDALGGTAAVAELFGIKQPSVSEWRKSGRIPDDKLIRLAPIAEARGIVSRKELFPNDWQAIWPELADMKASVAVGEGAHV